MRQRRERERYSIWIPFPMVSVLLMVTIYYLMFVLLCITWPKWPIYHGWTCPNNNLLLSFPIRPFVRIMRKWADREIRSSLNNVLYEIKERIHHDMTKKSGDIRSALNIYIPQVCLNTVALEWWYWLTVSSDQEKISINIGWLYWLSNWLPLKFTVYNWLDIDWQATIKLSR